MNMSSSSICFLSPHLRLTIILSTYILKPLKKSTLVNEFYDNGALKFIPTNKTQKLYR